MNRNFIRKTIRQYLNENENDYYILYHGTSSGNLNRIFKTPTKLFLTSDENVAIYYSAKGGEDYFLRKEMEFENEYGVTPDEYFNTEENGELKMFKSLYPENETPVVIEFKIPKDKINDIDSFMGYKGNELLVKPVYISKVINIDWEDLDY